MRTRLQIGAMSLGILAASIAGCADDNTPNRPEDQKTTGGSAGKTNTSAGATSKGGTTTTSVGGTVTTSSGGTTAAAGALTAAAGAVTATTGVGGASNSAAGSTGVGGASSTGGVVASTAGTTATGTGGATSTAGATSKGGTAGATGTSKGGNSTMGGAATVGGTAGKAATGGAPSTGGKAATGGTTGTGGELGVGGFLGIAGAPAYTPTCYTYVNGTTGDDFNDGTSWSAAKATMQAGIDKADQQGGCDVWVAKGTYKPTTSTVRTISIILRKNIRVYGGFVGTESSFDQRDYTNNVTTLSGDIGSAGSATDNSDSVVTGGEGATLDGFAITGGGSGLSTGGSAVYNTGARFTISNCSIFANSPSRFAVYNTGTDFVFRDSVVSNNGAGVSTSGARQIIYHSTFTNMLPGSALNISGANSQVLQCSFVGNSGSNGAAISASGTANVSNCEFKNNKATSVGGAIALSYAGGSYSFNNCTFSGNTAGTSGGAIGRLYIDANLATLGLSNCQFVDNAATTFGGAIGSVTYLDVTANDCSFTGNTAGTYGGAIIAHALAADRCSFTTNAATNYAGGVCLNGTAQSTITNSVFYGNTSGAEGGGALYLLANAKLKLINSTVGRNKSSVGGAVFNVAANSQLTLLNSILWQNLPDEVSGGTIVSTYTINTGNYFSGVGNSGADPLFVAAATGDLRLKTGSPALNAGITDGAPTVDLLGAARDATPDLGAYEGAASE